jgi:hypothetical protein
MSGDVFLQKCFQLCGLLTEQSVLLAFELGGLLPNFLGESNALQNVKSDMNNSSAASHPPVPLMHAHYAIGIY